MNSLCWYPGHAILIPDIVRADNSAVYDASGKRYVDLESGVWCTGIGHSHPRIREAITKQANQITHTGYCYTAAGVQEAAEAVLSVCGYEGGRCNFLSSGSEAVEFGVRVAQELMDRPKLLVTADGYFGALGAAHDRESGDWAVLDWLTCGDVDARMQNIPFDEIGGFLFEPGSSSGMVRFPPVELIHAIVDRIHDNGGLVIMNEVTTGIGRTGKWFGYEHYGIRPDIIAMGKGLGNGYPVSATAFRAGIFEPLDDSSFHYSQSHQNDPLGAAVAKEVLTTIREEGLIERGNEISEQLVGGLRNIKQETVIIEEIRARGLMIAVVIANDEGGARTSRIHRALVERGYIVVARPGLNVMRIDPPMTIPRSDVDGFLKAFREVLEHTVQ